jgi:hypothetical protein
MKIKLNRFIFVLIIIVLINFSYSYSQTSLQNDSIVSNFEKIVPILNRFFESNPIFLDEQPFSLSPTGRSFYLYKHWAPVELSYDIIKTESLISPYTGYIIVKIKYRLSNNEEGYGYTTLQECLKNSEFGVKQAISGGQYLPLTYNFAYRNGKWKFINIVALGNDMYDDDWDRPENIDWLFLKNIYP